MLPGGWYRKIFERYANKGRVMREGSEKRAYHRIRTSKRMWSGLTKSIGVEFDELCLRTRFTGCHIMRYEGGVSGSDRRAACSG